MSAPSRGAGASRARSTTPPTSRGRASRGPSRPYPPRGRGRGVAPTTTNPRAEGLLQGLQAGNLNKRGTEHSAIRGSGGEMTQIYTSTLNNRPRTRYRHSETLTLITRSIPEQFEVLQRSKGPPSYFAGPSDSDFECRLDGSSHHQV